MARLIGQKAATDGCCLLTGIRTTKLSDGQTHEDGGFPVELILPVGESLRSVQPQHGCGPLVSERAGG